MEFNESEPKAKFNMAVSYLGRINAFIYVADYYALNRDSYGWLNALMVIYRELSTNIPNVDWTNYDNDLITLNNLVMKASNSNVFSPALFMKLHRFEMNMRGIMKKAGLEMGTTENAREALK